MCIHVLHVCVGCIESSDTDQEPELNINALNPIDLWCVYMYIS